MTSQHHLHASAIFTQVYTWVCLPLFIPKRRNTATFMSFSGKAMVLTKSALTQFPHRSKNLIPSMSIEPKPISSALRSIRFRKVRALAASFVGRATTLLQGEAMTITTQAARAKAIPKCHDCSATWVE
jgi:hypothetical protein